MRRTGQTRQFIIERVAPVFNKQGFAGTSMADITRATKLTKGAIYGNFSDKEDVAAAVLDFNIAKVSSRIVQSMEEKDSVKEKLLVQIEVYGEMYGKMLENGGCPYMNAAIDTDDSQLLLFKKVQNKFKRWKLRLEKLIEEGRQNGEIKKEVNPNDFASYFIALVEGSILLSKTLNDSSIMKGNLEVLKREIEELF